MSDTDSDSEMIFSTEVEDDVEQRTNKRKSEDDELESSDAEISGDESSSNENSKPAKKKLKLSQFVLDEADVSDDDESDDDEDEMDDDEESDFLVTEEVEETGPTAREIENQIRLEEEPQVNETELNNYLQNKYSKPEENEEPLELYEASSLPTASDPFFWLVKCRLGSELDTVLLLTRKCLNSGLNLEVTSILLPEGTKGWIFVEAHKEGHVRQLIEGVSALAYGNKEIKFVPKDEMPQVMKTTKAKVGLRAKQFVRIAKGLFKGDLAEIVMIDSGKDMVHVKLFPRIDYTKTRGLPKAEQMAGNSRKIFNKPPQKAFESKTIEDIGGKVKVDGEFTVFEGNRYKDGFVYKIFPICAIVHEGVQPTESELQKFKRNAESSTNTSMFNIGDNVEVINHTMAGLKGKIVKMNEIIFTVQSKSEGQMQTMDFRQEELKKIFAVGDQVKVIRGMFQGNTGMVVRYDDDVVIFISDLNMTEVRVFSKDIQLSKDVARTIPPENSSKKFNNRPKANFNGQNGNIDRQAKIRDNHDDKRDFRKNTDGKRNGFAGRGKVSGNFKSNGFKKFANRQKMDLIGKIVKVTRGNYKSYTGYVKKANDELAVLQLMSDGKIISIATEYLSVFEDKAMTLSSTKKHSAPSRKEPSEGRVKTPLYPPQTPMHPPQTPMYDGSQTPFSQTASPRYDSAWDPKICNTPARIHSSPNANPRKGESVKFTKEGGKERTGVLINIDAEDGVVKLNNGEVLMVPLSRLRSNV